jgi:hypothetical protein
MRAVSRLGRRLIASPTHFDMAHPDVVGRDRRDLERESVNKRSEEQEVVDQ